MAKRREERILAWHILGPDKELGYRDGRRVRVGHILEMMPSVKEAFEVRANVIRWRKTAIAVPTLCEAGMHASRDLADAMAYRVEGYICRVEVWGDVVEGSDKLCGRFRKVLWMEKLENPLPDEFASSDIQVVKRLERRLLAKHAKKAKK